jgi:hypothetical protein
LQLGCLSTGTEPAQNRSALAQCYNGRGFNLVAKMKPPPCPHKRKQLIAEDKDAQYQECLDCGEIIEAGEIEKKEGAGFDESLSDA